MKPWHLLVAIVAITAIIASFVVVRNLAQEQLAQPPPPEAVQPEEPVYEPEPAPTPTGISCYEIPPAFDDDSRQADYVTYVPSKADIREPVTKFGGQPVWLDEPQWPISRQTGEPMTFVGQIKLDDELFPGGAGKIAYIFMVEFDYDKPSPQNSHNVMTWDAFGGDNAVIVQPEGAPLEAVGSNATGPTVTDLRAQPQELGFEPAAYNITAERRSDLPIVHPEDYGELTDAEWMARDGMFDDKIGGVPEFLQGPEFPFCSEDSRLVMQLGLQPFALNLGDGGVLYAFLNEEMTAGRMLWQSH